MTPEERAGLVVSECYQMNGTLTHFNGSLLEGGIAEAIRVAVAEEREACALVADQLSEPDGGVAAEVAARIRARGEPRLYSTLEITEPVECPNAVPSPTIEQLREAYNMVLPIWKKLLDRQREANLASIGNALQEADPAFAEPQIIGEKLEELYDHLAPALAEQGVIPPKLPWVDVLPPEKRDALIRLLDKAKEHGGVTMPAEPRPIDDPENWKMSVVNDPTNFDPADPQPDAIAEPAQPSFIWGGRLVKVEDGNFVMSRVGKHDDFDFAAMDKEAAVAGNPGGRVRAIEQIDDVTLRLRSDVGTFTLIGGPDLNTWVIGADIKLGREPSHDV